MLSPAFGAIIGAAAALVAAWVAWRKITADSDDAARERWWATLRWVYEMVTAERPDARLPPSLAMRMVDSLVDEAETLVQIEAAGSMMEMFNDATGGASANTPQDTGAVSGPRGSRLHSVRAALRQARRRAP